MVGDFRCIEHWAIKWEDGKGLFKRILSCVGKEEQREEESREKILLPPQSCDGYKSETVAEKASEI